MKFLLIEDDTGVAGHITKGLGEAGHIADHSADGKQGLFLATSEAYDAMIIDRMLPGVDGLTIIKTLRGAGNTTPALILSALGEVDDRVRGLRSGGDDYLVKPFAFTELLARIEILARRGDRGGEAPVTKLCAGDLEMDLLARKVRRGATDIDLQSREFALLEYMLRNKGQVVTRTMLLENVWDYNFDPQTNVIDVHISRLRGKIDIAKAKDNDKNKNSGESVIRTVRGAGYIIED